MAVTSNIKGLKVLHIISKLNVGGAERVVIDLVNICSEQGGDVSLMSLLDAGELSGHVNKDVKQYFLNRTEKFSFKTLYRLSKIISQFDVIHVHTRHVLKYVILSKVFFFNKFPKLVYQDHTGVLTNSKVLKYIFSFVNAYVSVSIRNVKWASETMKITNVHLLPNIVRRVNVPESNDKKGVVMVGNIRPEKNYPFIFKLAAITKSKIDIYGKFTNNGYREEIEKLIPDNVRITDGVSDMQGVLGKYEMALHCAPVETGPLVLIEYLAQGIPFITYNTGQVVEQIKNDLHEFIVNTFDTDEWLNAIGHLKKMMNEIMRA
jgi:glycosyltransferase involved in cell wall biosynthesis